MKLTIDRSAIGRIILGIGALFFFFAIRRGYCSMHDGVGVSTILQVSSSAEPTILCTYSTGITNL